MVVAATKRQRQQWQLKNNDASKMTTPQQSYNTKTAATK